MNTGTDEAEKGSVVQVETHQTNTTATIYEEDERFEWGEVLRGNLRVAFYGPICDVH